MVTSEVKSAAAQPVHAGGFQFCPISDLLQTFTAAPSSTAGYGGIGADPQGGWGPDCCARPSAGQSNIADNRNRTRHGAHLLDGVPDWIGSLTPMAFDKDVTAPAVFPAMLFPTCARVRRAFPSAGLPVVGILVPAVVAVNPHIVASRCTTTSFNDDTRRCDADEDLRCHARPYCQDSCKH